MMMLSTTTGMDQTTTLNDVDDDPNDLQYKCGPLVDREIDISTYGKIATNTWRRVGLPQPINNDVFVGVHPLEVVHMEDDDENIDAVRGDDDQQEQEDLWMYDDTGSRMALNNVE